MVHLLRFVVAAAGVENWSIEQGRASKEILIFL